MGGTRDFAVASYLMAFNPDGSPMSSPLTHGGRGADKAFTLIELLTVIAIIGVLAGITFGVMKGAQERAAVNQTRTDLAAITTALDGYKRQYGDYPQTGASGQAGTDATPALGSITTGSAQAKLFNALGGKLGPRMTSMNGKVYLPFAQHSLERTDLPDPANTTEVANALVDPWGRRYIYYYKNNGSPGTWIVPSYILFSAGPDGKAGVTIAATGEETVANAAEAADNIYANR